MSLFEYKGGSSKETPTRFWRFQLVGWTLFIGFTFPTKLVVYGSLSEVMGSIILRDGISFLLTLLMREIYRRVYRRHKEPLWIIGSSLVVSSGAALIQLPPYFWLSEIFPYEEKTIFGPYAAWGILSFRGGQFLGWSILYFGTLLSKINSFWTKGTDFMGT